MQVDFAETKNGFKIEKKLKISSFISLCSSNMLFVGEESEMDGDRETERSYCTSEAARQTAPSRRLLWQNLATRRTLRIPGQSISRLPNVFMGIFPHP